MSRPPEWIHALERDPRNSACSCRLEPESIMTNTPVCHPGFRVRPPARSGPCCLQKHTLSPGLYA
eukprot:4199396-Amphidinium_carterae.1